MSKAERDVVSHTEMLSALKNHWCFAEALQLYALLKDKGRPHARAQRAQLAGAHRPLRCEARTPRVCERRKMQFDDEALKALDLGVLGWFVRVFDQGAILHSVADWL